MYVNFTVIKRNGKASGKNTCSVLLHPLEQAVWILHTFSCWSDLSEKRTRNEKVCSFLGTGQFPTVSSLEEKKKGKDKTTILIFHQNILKCLVFSKKNTPDFLVTSDLRVFFFVRECKVKWKAGFLKQRHRKNFPCLSQEKLRVRNNGKKTSFRQHLEASKSFRKCMEQLTC